MLLLHEASGEFLPSFFHMFDYLFQYLANSLLTLTTSRQKSGCRFAFNGRQESGLVLIECYILQRTLIIGTFWDVYFWQYHILYSNTSRTCALEHYSHSSWCFHPLTLFMSYTWGLEEVCFIYPLKLSAWGSSLSVDTHSLQLVVGLPTTSKGATCGNVIVLGATGVVTQEDLHRSSP